MKNWIRENQVSARDGNKYLERVEFAPRGKTAADVENYLLSNGMKYFSCQQLSKALGVQIRVIYSAVRRRPAKFRSFGSGCYEFLG